MPLLTACGHISSTRRRYAVSFPIFSDVPIIVSVLSVVSAQPQLPGQEMSIAKHCKSYIGTACSGVIDYDYLGKEKGDGEEKVRAALKSGGDAVHRLPGRSREDQLRPGILEPHAAMPRLRALLLIHM